MIPHTKKLREILDRISYRPGWDWDIDPAAETGWHIRPVWDGPDVITGQPARQRGRWWYIAENARVGEVVRTAFLAISTAEEHERREQFRYQGVRIYLPHHDVDALAEFVASGAATEA